MKVLGLIVVLAALGGCGKRNPAEQAAQDIKAMGEHRAKAEDTLKQLEESQNKAKEAADKAGEEKQ